MGGLFHSPFILQTFTFHLSVIERSMKILGLHNANKPTPTACGGLGLSVTSVSGLCILLSSYTNLYKVEQALRLVTTSTLTIDMVHAVKSKTVNLPKTMNLATGKESMHQTGFSNVAWGKATHNYVKSVCLLSMVWLCYQPLQTLY
jgi:hypothetical protein